MGKEEKGGEDKKFDVEMDSGGEGRRIFYLSVLELFSAQLFVQILLLVCEFA